MAAALGGVADASRAGHADGRPDRQRPDRRRPDPELATELEDGSYRHWLANRSAAPAEWQRDQTSSDILHLTSDELADLGAAVRALLAPYRQREPRRGTHPVAAVTRLFPLLASTGGEAETH